VSKNGKKKTPGEGTTAERGKGWARKSGTVALVRKRIRKRRGVRKGAGKAFGRSLDRD